MTRLHMLIPMAASIAVASCASPQLAAREDGAAQARLAARLAGYSAGPAQRCLSNYRARHLEVIDGDTLLYRDGRNVVYRQETNGDCYPRGEQNGYALVTRPIGGGNELCAGDIAQVVHVATRTIQGSCAFGPFVPYRRP